MKVENLCNSNFCNNDFAITISSCAAAKPVNKSALSFILAAPLKSEIKMESPVPATKPLTKRKRANSSTCTTARKAPRSDSFASLHQDTAPAAQASDTTALIKKGSKFCVIDGCMSRAKHAKRCWRHGGSVKCKVADCDNRAKSKGVCWSHGGGTLCSFDKCDTISVSNGFCWAHGGGKRCAVHQCSKPAYERTQNYCTAHFEELHAAQYYGGSTGFIGA